MRKGRHNICAMAAILAGFLIMLSQLLPKQFWWLMLAFALIAFGVWRLRRC